MKAFAQPLAGIIRVGPDTDQYGKPWDYAVTYSSGDNDTCILLALKGDGNFTTAHRRAIFDCAHALGFRRVRWDRLKDERKRAVNAELPVSAD